MILSEQEVTNIIPQKHPMIMVGKLISINEASITTEFTIPKTHILLENNILPNSALIENMAQTAAVKAGYIAKSQKSKPKTGFIGAIKNFEIFNSVSAGDTLTTTIETTNEIFNASIIEGVIYCNKQLIAKGELKIFLVDDENQNK